MKRIYKIPGFLLLTYLVYGVIISIVDVRVLTSDLGLGPSYGQYDYKGVVNVHSEMSSGSGSIADIVKAAQETSLDFIIINDLNVFDKPKEHEGYYNDLMVLVDAEYGYLNSRLLNFGSNVKWEMTGPGDSQVMFTDILNRKEKDPKEGLFFVAHPFKKDYEWSGEIPPGLDGLEVINLKKIWQHSWLYQRASFLWTILIYPFNPRLAMIRLFEYPSQELNLWDQVSKTRKFTGIAGSDAEAKIKLFDAVNVQFPSYPTLFSIVSNHVLLNSELTGQFARDQEKILRALKLGQFYLSLDLLANPKGFVAVLKTANHQVHPMGTEIKIEKGQKIFVQIPKRPLVPFEIALYRDGEKVMAANETSAEYAVDKPGVYRVMVRVIPTFPIPDGKRWIPWIFSNPFYIRN